RQRSFSHCGWRASSIVTDRAATVSSITHTSAAIEAASARKVHVTETSKLMPPNHRNKGLFGSDWPSEYTCCQCTFIAKASQLIPLNAVSAAAINQMESGMNDLRIGWCRSRILRALTL